MTVLRGAWREQPLEWYAEPKDSCEVCGRLVPSRRWVFTAGEREIGRARPSASSSTSTT